MADTQALMERIQALPPERIAEVEDFVAFLAAREENLSLIRCAAAASEPSFAKAWDNPEDDVYDAL
jgi:hypothetical protein